MNFLDKLIAKFLTLNKSRQITVIIIVLLVFVVSLGVLKKAVACEHHQTGTKTLMTFDPIGADIDEDSDYYIESE
ncbi:hypothetical protein [Cysteiniphilum halobium]|uniref:hypothetical protein n=1 Tax=Cysteiniphilum halobium TaxID=2219059 RepID=UPI003F842EFC